MHNLWHVARLRVKASACLRTLGRTSQCPKNVVLGKYSDDTLLSAPTWGSRPVLGFSLHCTCFIERFMGSSSVSVCQMF
eukprot:1151662-Pelagomonas_calceolata.AAC.1